MRAPTRVRGVSVVSAAPGVAALAAVVTAVLAAFLAAASPAGLAAQIAGPVLRIQPPAAPGVSPPGSALGLPGPWDPLGLLGPASPSGPSPFAVAPQSSDHAQDIVLIPALFADSDEPHVPVDEIRRILFDGPREGGTFVDFYREASRGAIEPGGHVADWVRTDVTMLEAAGSENGHGWFTALTGDYIAQAVARADPSLDYRLFDNDGPDGVPDSGDDDGFIDVLVVEFLEVAGSCGGPSIWPHFSGVSEAEGVPGIPTDDVGASGEPIRAYTYLTQGVTDCTGEEPQGPNVMAHEYGHRLGLPDWYQAIDGFEPWNRHWNVGCFGLMGAGSWGCGTGIKLDGFGPVHHSAFSKALLGWMEEVVVADVLEREYVLEPAQTTGRTLHIPLSPAGDESLWIEYRPRIGFDTWLPAGGVLLYHRDDDAANRQVPPGLPPAKPLHLIEADGDHALRKVEALGGNRGVAADVFGVEGPVGPFSSAQGPVRLLRHDGTPVPVTIHSIEVEDDAARVVVSNAPVPTLVHAEPGTGLRALEEATLATFRLAGGALPYAATDEDPDTDFEVVMAGTEGTLTGRPLGVGAVTVDVRVTDALGTVTTVSVGIDVEDAEVDVDALVDAVLAGGGAGSDEAAYLDGQGNQNGRPDVGDLRAYLRRTGGVS